MKRFLLALLVCICFSKATLANKIDSLRTDENTEQFIRSLFEKTFKMNYYTFSFKRPDSVLKLIPCDSTILNWETKSWQKIDFNKDGLTDLFAAIYKRDTINSVAARYTIYIVMDKGNNQYELQEIPEFHIINCYAAKPIFINNDPYILYRHYKTEYTVDSLPKDSMPGIDNYHYFEVGKTDTLLYKYGAFVELNTTKLSPAVKSVFFETTSCLGFCPVFKINLFNNSNGYYTPEYWNEKEGNFQAMVRRKELNEIFGLIRYLGFPALKNYYSTEGTDYPSCSTTVFFTDGSVKKIVDYGQQGTQGLVRLYKLFFLLRENQDWK